MDCIKWERREGWGLLTLDRPDCLNSFNAAMHGEVQQCLAEVRDDDELRALLMTGAGRGFCAGQDLGDRDPEAERADLGATVEQYWNPLVRAIAELPVPVVCAVNGVAAGAGSSLALACDIVLAARSASFIQAFSNIGLVPDTSGSWHLPRALGLPRARALAMLGDKLGAQQAADWGLIWQCVDDGQLMPEAEQLAARLAARPTLALAAIKQLFNDTWGLDFERHLQAEQAAMRRLGFSDDYAEGVRAFADKRAPRFRGR